MPCLFQSTTQKEERPWFVLEDSTQHNAVSILPHSTADIPCLLKLDAFMAFQAVSQTPPLKEEFWGRNSGATDTTAFVPMPFGSASCDIPAVRRQLRAVIGTFFCLLGHLIPFHSGTQPRQNNHLMGVESDYHCSVLSPMSAENIVQQQQLLAPVMLGQVRSRWWGLWGGVQPRGERFSMGYVCVIYKRCMHWSTASRFAWISN